MRTVNRKRLANCPVEPAPEYSEPPPNRWPTQRELLEVSKRLARISRLGMQREIAGDYFKSGEWAYQLAEIIRTTDALFKETKRLKS